MLTKPTCHNVEQVPVHTGGAQAWSGPCALVDNPFVARMNGFRRLTDEEGAVLRAATHCASNHSVGHTLFFEGYRSDHVCVLIEGVACRYQLLPGGRRQILGYVLPGDLCDLDFLLSGKPSYSIELMTTGRVAQITRAKLREIIERYVSIGHALRLAASLDHAILRQWLLNIGQRDGIERMSHFLCEFETRMTAIGQSNADGSLPFCINQSALADTLGMSLVHVNRSLQALRRGGFIQLQKRTLTITDRRGLADVADFDPHYLQLPDACLA